TLTVTRGVNGTTAAPHASSATVYLVNDVLAAPVTPAATTVTVASGAGFPALGNFRIRIDSEIMLVTAINGKTFTVQRGVSGTLATSHAAGAPVFRMTGSSPNDPTDTGLTLRNPGTPTNPPGTGLTNIPTTTDTTLVGQVGDGGGIGNIAYIAFDYV